VCTLAGVPAAPNTQDVIFLGAAVDMIFETLQEVRDEGGKTLILVEQNARKGLEFTDLGYVLVAGRSVKAASGAEVLPDPDMGCLFSRRLEPPTKS
jgi:ABC-type branched-subunit amino acid transport system ATPase component